jgi:regulator of sirC expression with transglutaminase-like and TPR domain
MNEKFDSPQSAHAYLKLVGSQVDDDINVLEASLALAAAHRPSIVIDKYRIHIDKMARDLKREFDRLSALKNSDDVNVQAEALKTIVIDHYEYKGDQDDYHNLQNVDVMRVIDRLMGMPITLCIIAIAISRKIGWTVSGVNFPGHFLMQIEKDGQRLILDIFGDCKIVAAPDLRAMIKMQMGVTAELSNAYYAPCSNRDMLLRLQNNIKYRLIESEHYDEALRIVELMMVFAPRENRLRLDMAVLLSRLDQPAGAIDHLSVYIDHVDDALEKQEALQFMKELTNSIN